ncbi:MAG: hypothetical protein O2971_01600 [Proteobacteria bacterium]|nr:hypothetical protein [Pseudomonadota bacterium]
MRSTTHRDQQLDEVSDQQLDEVSDQQLDEVSDQQLDEVSDQQLDEVSDKRANLNLSSRILSKQLTDYLRNRSHGKSPDKLDQHDTV